MPRKFISKIRVFVSKLSVSFRSGSRRSGPSTNCSRTRTGELSTTRPATSMRARIWTLTKTGTSTGGCFSRWQRNLKLMAHHSHEFSFYFMLGSLPLAVNKFISVLCWTYKLCERLIPRLSQRGSTGSTTHTVHMFNWVQFIQFDIGDDNGWTRLRFFL